MQTQTAHPTIQTTGLTWHVRETSRLQQAARRIAAPAARLAPITLDEMNGVKLLDRTDTKFIMRVSQLADLLPALGEAYRILDIDGTRLNHYQTLYFDTPDFLFYHQHHNDQRPRYKVRSCEYLDTQVAYLEVKRKNSRDRTKKYRLPTPDLATDVAAPLDDFVDAHMPLETEQLEPKLWNEFLRLTLVSTRRQERLTLDLNLEFGADQAYAALPGLVVAEVKQASLAQPSDFMQAMRQYRIAPQRFSKYCAGVYLLYPRDVKINNFKARMRRVAKLMRQEEGEHGRFH